MDTKKLVNEFIDLDFKAVISCVNIKKLDESFTGKQLDKLFLHNLPDHVDACGENGEFHSFVYAGPIFKSPIDIIVGDKVFKGDGCYCDLLISKIQKGAKKRGQVWT